MDGLSAELAPLDAKNEGILNRGISIFGIVILGMGTLYQLVCFTPEGSGEAFFAPGAVFSDACRGTTGPVWAAPLPVVALNT